MPAGLPRIEDADAFHASHDRVWDEDSASGQSRLCAAMVSALQGPDRQLPAPIFCISTIAACRWARRAWT